MHPYKWDWQVYTFVLKKYISAWSSAAYIHTLQSLQTHSPVPSFETLRKVFAGERRLTTSWKEANHIKYDSSIKNRLCYQVLPNERRLPYAMTIWQHDDILCKTILYVKWTNRASRNSWAGHCHWISRRQSKNHLESKENCTSYRN